MSNYTFASMPSVSIARSKFHRTMPHNTSFNLGELVVLGLDECIPGSTHKVEIGSLIRMSTPIAPIMDDIQFDIYSFFVPMRLTWEHWKQFMGESDTAGIPVTSYTIPMIQDFVGSHVNSDADDFGLVGVETVTSAQGGNNISVLPFRALALIYNRFFRNQNVESKIPVNLGDTVTVTELTYLSPGIDIYVGGGGTPIATYNSKGRYKVYKLPDYFTSALPYAQKGDPVQIFGDDAYAPVYARSQDHDLNLAQPPHVKDSSGNVVNGKLLGAYGTAGNMYYGDVTGKTLNGGAAFSNLWANLSASVNTTINDLRFAFQLQKALEKDSLYGSRYWEVLRAHYSVTSPDATLQDPEILGAIKFDINISQVLQTTGFTSPSSTNLGTPGANSVTANRGHVCTFSTVEHGYLITVGCARQKRHTYSQQMNKLWMRNSRFDFYHPVFANIGAEKLLVKELFYDGTQTGNDVFGFQEAWSSYRFLPGYNSGLLNPARTGSLDYWTLADKYTTAPTLSASFLKEDRSNLARALVTGVTGPDFIGSFFIKDTVVNPMPLYSIPGFADHH